MSEEDDESEFGGVYENGHWVWEESTKEIIFRSDLSPEVIEDIQISIKAPTGAIEFRDDVDPIEQLRFRRRYQRKLNSGQPDIITLQDIKDIAIYTAPLNILSAQLLSMLHIPTTERFIRALVLYIQYHLQIANEMIERILELQKKVRTPYCDIVERGFRENLSDLRLLVAKEYSTVLLGGSDTRKFHHMGPNKKRRSLTFQDARLIETFLRICVQIVWLALGRKSFHQIELEVHRIFKTEFFNSVEHRLHTDYISKMTKEEREVLLGHCLRHQEKPVTRSPLINEVFCSRHVDYRVLGLGVIMFPEETPRLLYLKNAIAAPEELLADLGVTLGIIGVPRSGFDTMLRPIPIATDNKSRLSTGSSSLASRMVMSSTSTKRSHSITRKLYPNVVLPEREPRITDYPPSFSLDSEQIRPCNEVQLKLWQKRLRKLLKPYRSY